MRDKSTTLSQDNRIVFLKAFLVGIQGPDSNPEEAKELLEELVELVRTLGLENCGCLSTRLRLRQAAYVVGSGKADEIVEAAQQCDADVIILDEMLTPAQQRNWEKLSQLAVIDRQEVILSIFAARAQTSEAKLQVALAQANYDLPRLKRRWTHLNRQRGMAGGLGGRAEGEQQLEIDSRLIRSKISKLKQQLEQVRKQRQVQRQLRLRQSMPLAAIVGYTNAGKSSLLNALTNTGVLTEDKLFATLDPTIRKVSLPGGQQLLLADTVGFIRKLPHLLIEAFKATLEETILSDCLIEVLDASSVSVQEHHETSMKVLDELGIGTKPMIMVLNKIDLLPDPLALQRLRHKFPEAVPISCQSGAGLPELLQKMLEISTTAMRSCRILLPHTHAELLGQLRKNCVVESETYLAEGCCFELRCPVAFFPKLASFLCSDAELQPANF